MFFKRLKRFLRQFFHPGTWILFSLLAVVAGIFFPFAAPALMIFAVVAIGIAAAAFVPYIASFFHQKTLISFFPRSLKYNRSESPLPHPPIGAGFRQTHPFQLAIILIGTVLFIAALTLTIGFFTGGAGFAFMAPVFAALAAPFAAAGASAGISLFLPALAGTILILGALNLTNTLKRFVAWLDSFKYDHAAGLLTGKDKYDRPWEDGERDGLVEQGIRDSGYPAVVFKGMWATITNGCASPDADRLEYEPPKIQKVPSLSD